MDSNNELQHCLILQTVWVPNSFKPQFLTAGELLKARLAPGPHDTRPISQLSISSNIKPTSSTGMTVSAAPAYSHINAFSWQSCHCLPGLGPQEPFLPGKHGSCSSRAAMELAHHRHGTAGCHSPAAAPALSWQPGTFTEP